MKHSDLIINSFIVLTIALGLNVSKAHAGAEYCNKMGNTLVCNQYHTDGQMESTYYNKYGDTVIGNTYNDRGTDDNS